MGAQHFTTRKGKPAFSHDGFTYRLDRRTSDGEQFYWRCIDHSCYVRMEMMGMLGPLAPRCRQEHTYAPKPEDGIVCNFICAMKEAARTIYEEKAVSIANTNATAALSHPLFILFLQEPLLNINDERQWGDEAMMLSRPSWFRLPCGHDASKFQQ